MTITATLADLARITHAERLLLDHWRDCLTTMPAPVVAGMIEAAVDFAPILATPMEPCENRGCALWVDDNARDEHGRLHCSPECRDEDEQDIAERAEERRIRDGYDRGLDVRPTMPSIRW